MKCGVVDVGSNTIRLSIYRWSDGNLKLLLNKKEMAGLAGYVEDGALSDAGLLVACRILASFRTLLDNFDIKDMYVFATASLRNITNTEEALDTIEAITGLKIDLLSGADEAALSFRGAALGGGHPSGLLTDIGGGSTELVAFQDHSITSGCSLPMGSLSLYSRFVNDLLPSKEERRTMEAFVEDELKKARTDGVRCSHLVGVGGTIRATAKLYNAMVNGDPDNNIIIAEEVQDIYKTLRRGDKSNLRQILRTCPDRVHTILPGLSILSAIIDTYKVKTISISTHGVREGYLLDRIIKE